MKKILVFMILLIGNLNAKSHPNLPLKYLAVEGKFADSFLADLLDIHKSNLCFVNDGKQYKISIEIEGESSLLIDSFESDREILSVFFYEISGDGVNEIFIITKRKGIYKIYSYGINYYTFSYSFEPLKILDKKLNNLFSNRKNLNADMIKAELKGKIPLDYSSLYYWNNQNKAFYKGIDFSKGEFIGYFDSNGKKIKNSSKAEYYLKKYERNIYGKFDKFDSFSLTRVFEGLEKNKAPYYIKHGRYEYSDGYSYEKGTYLNDLKHGDWEHNERMNIYYGRYNMNNKVGNWYINNYSGLFINNLKNGLWKSDDGIYEKLYDMGRLIEFKEYNYDSHSLKRKTIYLENGEKTTENY